MATRAQDHTAKEARRNTILQAARRLFVQDPHQLPSASRIAQEAGLAKGTVYLYFTTKEEIFLALLGEEFGGLLAEITAIFAQSPVRIDVFIQRYTAYLVGHPEFLRLDALSHSVLEQNLEPERLREFKLALVHAASEAGAQVDAALGLAGGSGLNLLLRTYSITKGLWQSLDYPPPLQLLLADAVFAPLRPAFETELLATLDAYWRGALATAA